MEKRGWPEVAGDTKGVTGQGEDHSDEEPEMLSVTFISFQVAAGF